MTLAGVGLVAMLLVFATAAAGQGEHGLGGSTNCASPTKIGDPVFCTYTIRNNSDDFGDTMRAHTVELTAQSAGGSVPSGNVFGSLQWVFTPAPGNPNAPSCTGGSGLGTMASPYINATSCDIPFDVTVAGGVRISSLPFSFYTATAADFTLPGSILPMLAVYKATDLCDAPGTENCPTEDLTVSPNSQTMIVKRNSATATAIHDAAHQTVLTVEAGSTVHDFVMVTSADGGPVPTGNVNIDWFLNGDCSGAPAANSGSVGPLDGAGNFDATGFAFTVNSAGMRSFKAHYEGDGTYNPSDGDCEPLQIVDANIQITPNGVNRVGESHVFTAHVNVNDGTGSANAPDGTQISFTIDSGPGGFTTANPCTTAGGTGSCSITLLSNATGVTTVSAHTTVSVGGLSLTRDTNGVGANSGPATKTWVNARISIAPDATNEVGAPHTFTVTLEKDPGTGVFAPAAGEHVDVLLTNQFGAGFVLNAGASTCDNAGANTDAAGQCVMVFTSPTPGQVTGHASATLSVNGSAPFMVETNGVAPNSGDAVKTFVDAYIDINPPLADNPVDTIHTYTASVFINAGLGGGYVPAPNGTLVTFTLLPGSVGNFTGGNTCLTAGGSCPIDTTSPTPGTDTMQASTTLAVGGVTMTRTTGQASPGHANSGNAVKNWIGGPCPVAPAAFGLGAAGNYTVLLLEGGKLVISQGETKITGNVGMAANTTGDLLKATIDGDLFLDPTANPNIHAKDLKVTGSIVTKDMGPEHTDALLANLTLAGMAPTQPAIGTITTNTTITGGPGTNVISLAGVNMVKKTLTISGSASSLFIINVTGGFNFSQSLMVLAGGVQPNNIIWNFIGPGADVNIFKTGTQAYGTYLAPYRNFVQDHAVVNGRYIGATGGLSLKIHSAATVTCP